MQKTVKQMIQNFTRQRTQRRRAYAAFTTLAILVSITTMYSLSQPASTMTGELICGQEEHIHTDACYTEKLICGLEEQTESVEDAEEHVHDESCYEPHEVLVCTEEETEAHSHDESCYGLVCGETEYPAHTHGDDCYAVVTETCGQEEHEAHSHDDSCYTTTRSLTCGEAESAGHTHDDSCYDENGELTCGQSESAGHTHSDSCYTESTALTCGQSESAGHTHDDSCTVRRVELTCTAQEGPGHVHDDSCYGLICGKEETEGHTHTEECYETRNELICTAGHVHTADCYEKVLTCELPEHIHNSTCYAETQPEAPDESEYICGLPAHTHDDSCLDEEGNLICGLEEHVHDESCLAPEIPESEYTAVYGNISELPDDAVLVLAEELASEEQDEDGMPIPSYLFHYGDDALDMTIQLTGDASVAAMGAALEVEEIQPEIGEPLVEEPGAEETAGSDTGEENDWTEGLVLAVIPQREESEAYLDAAEYAAANANEEDELYHVSAYEVYFFRDGAELDVTDCEVTVELSPKEEAVAADQPVMAAPMSLEEESAQEAAPMARRAVMSLDAPADGSAEEEQPAETQTAETAIRVSVLQDTDGEVTETDSTLVAADEAAGTVMRFTLQSNRMAVTLSQTANPRFTVGYYAWVEQATLSDSGTLAVINTDKGGANQGGNLPQNGVQPYLKYLNIKDGKIVVNSSLEQVYRDYEYHYIEAPNLSYFNRLYENGNYELKEVWVRNEGDEDWTKYTNPTTLHFTNRESSKSDDTVLIKNGTKIQLVYDTTSGSYDNEANFYDYDITDGTRKKFDSKKWTNTTLFNTKEQGINSARNYAGSGAKLGFGNNNAGSGLENVTWSGNTLNKGNGNGYKECTFGLASGMNGEEIRYADGVVAPKLFNDGSAAGKTTFSNNSLTFARSGDTYTLRSVSGQSGIGISGLDTFNNPNGEGYTNNFWPLDGVSNTVDPQFGDPIHAYYRANGTASTTDPLYAYKISDYGTPSFTFPRSDNSQNHNNYFGMNYAVSFKLTQDYVGPLNYLFFGDDDMWVFLTDSKGNSRLVCDIGGVHSSVGEYINLWDYIQKDGRTEDETYTLSFFYTERGASGSSCYMRFTLPSVSSATPEQNTGTLRVEKKVEGAGNPDQEFQFEIHFTDANENPLRDDYSYTRYDATGKKIKSDVIIYDGGSFELEDGEYVMIRYLPVGTKYTITEKAADGYTTTYKVNNGEVKSGSTVTGSIELLRTDTVCYINTVRSELPNTGGMGTQTFTFLGMMMMLSAGVLLMIQRRRREGI
ncbi:DUF7601 domain-containing protein [Pseudoflavonifractor phocaeensis]|uniref:DUF7601 domain-containing protein n=1 Tax=Pseudoflavonifractor phocaeensis TaxID=1870988 RepID=UPI001F332125|nr:fibro-slime domain-containing protein [Pseudoflavonifractor phocaeensis]MCF2596771.1 fibro-slime domain-containing protein [Pseudoflavonifractor phocaeensis]